MMMSIHTDDDDERERYVDSQIVRSSSPKISRT